MSFVDPPELGRPMTRSSSSSTLSCIALQHTASDLMSKTQSMTNTDASSVSTDASKQKETDPPGRRIARTRRSQISSYNETILSRTSVSKSRKSISAKSRAISGATLVNQSSGDDLLGQSIKALDMEWSIDSLPGDKASIASNKDDALKRRSTRLELVDKAKAGVADGISVLGKRGRETLEAGKDGIKDMARGLQRRATLMTSTNESKVEEPGSKRAKTQICEKPRSRPKPWLAKGLYIGQNRHFDPRLTEAKNRLLAARKQSEEKERSILPLPMFGGQRLLDVGRDFKLPYDVFAPLPPGQPKPEEWRKTQKNVFVGDAASIWKSIKLQEVSRCLCTPESSCDEDCQNRYMFYECDDSNCNMGADHCTNRAFENLRKRCKAGGKYNVGVEVMKTDGKGYGVRSNRTFEPSQIIVEYAGEIITQDECEERMNTLYKDNECYYLMLFDQNMIIDATRGSIARFVNHSCEPNCKMVKWTVAGKPRMALFAGENGIMTGEELTYDYNFDPFSVKNVQECRCGAKDCRGVLGPKPKESRSVLNNIIGQAKNMKRKVQETLVGDDGGQKTQKKRKLAVPKSSRMSTSTASPIIQRTTLVRKGSSINKASTNKNKRTSSTTPLMSRTNITKSSKIRRMASTLKSKGAAAVGIKDSVKRDTVKNAAASVRRGVERSLRGPRSSQALTAASSLMESRNASGSTIRVVAVDDET